MTSTFMALDQRPTERRHSAWLVLVKSFGLGVLAVAIFAHVMTFPLGHDEQIHVAAAQLFLREPLYGALGYNHLPGLPILLGSIYRLTDGNYLLLAGRLLICAGWAAIACAFRVIARANGEKDDVAIVAMLVFAAGAPLGPTGMLVTNNLLPIPFALFGLHLFLSGMPGSSIRQSRIFAAGVMIGFAVMLKISYVFMVPAIFLSALLAPGVVGFAGGMLRVIPVLAAGLAVGCAPALLVVATGSHMLYAHTVRYFTTAHLAFWQHSAEPKAMSLAAKAATASDVWLTGSGMLAALLAGTCAWTLARRSPARLGRWPIWCVALLVLFAMAGAFAPTPAFPQYYEPPIPLMIALVILLHARLDHADRAALRPLFGMAALVALAIIVPRLITNLPAVAHPARWTGVAVHRQGRHIADLLAARHLEGRVATLAPIVVLEGGLPIYREFASGPFVYRVADYMPAADRPFFTTTSPHDLTQFLTKNPPVAIVTGREAALDPAFEGFARARHFTPVDTGDADTRLFAWSPEPSRQ